MLIKPYTSVGNLLFTDSRQQIREKLNKSFITGVKGHIDYYDYFENIGLFVYYDSNDNLNAFEFFESNPIFNDVDLLSLFYNQLVELFKKIDPDFKNEFNTFTSYKYGIGGSTNDDPELDESMPEAVIIFRKGYYDVLN